MITQEKLKELLKYDPDTGVFTWKIQKRNRYIEKAGWEQSGYIRICINQKSYTAHRLAWFYVYGYLPKQIDHINRIKTDNRILNLRDTSFSLNARNRDLSILNKSGIVGVSQNKNKWVSQIRHLNKPCYLGIYEDIEDAICARLAAEQCLEWMKLGPKSSAYNYVKEFIQNNLK